MIKVCSKSVKQCVLCRHWGDPGNRHITKVTPNNIEYEETAVEQCYKTGIKMKARNKCAKFESKM